ncbi:MAG: hypothetical protein AAF206_00745 [Bacteroidota bacterium]
MKRFIFFLLFGPLLGGLVNTQAQPGPFGFDLAFRVFKPNGQLVTRQDTQVKITPIWDDQSNEDFPDHFEWVTDSTLIYQSVKTPLGGYLPPNLAIQIEYRSDSMKILHVDRHSNLDSIPILDGVYEVPYYRTLLRDFSVSENRVLHGIDWSDFEVSRLRQREYFMLERLPIDRLEGLDKMEWDDWRLIEPVMNDGDSLILTYLPFHILLRSQDGGKNWYVLPMAGRSGYQSNDGENIIYPFEWHDVKQEADNLWVSGVQQFGYHASVQRDSGIFKMHIGIRENDYGWHMLRELEQQYLLDWVKEYNRKIEKVRLTQIYQQEIQLAQSTEMCPLEEGTYQNPNDNRYGCQNCIITPTLELEDGRFTFHNRYRTDENGSGAYVLRGTYSLGDSLIHVNVLEDSYPDRSSAFPYDSNLRTGTYYFTCYDGMLRMFNYEYYLQAIDIKLKKVK